MSDAEQVTALVRRRGETPLGSLLTAGRQALQTPQGTPEVVAVWWVPSDQGHWLVAVGTAGTWAVRAPSARLQAGWTRDVLHVGRWSAPLRRGTRRAARDLLQRVQREAPAEGRPAEEVVEAPEGPEGLAARERSPAAEGARVPGWWAEQVPGPAEGRWLLALQTATRWPIGDPGCQVRQPWLWIGVGDTQVVLAAAEAPAPTWWREVTGPLQVARRRGRDRLIVDELELPVPLLGADVEGLLALAEAEPGPERWAVAATVALERGEVARALALLREAQALDRHGRCWEAMARLLEAAGQPERAAAALQQHLRQEGVGPGQAEVWTATRDKVAKGLQRDRVEPEALAGLAEGLEPVCPLEGLPWPPEGPAEVRIAALAGLGRLQEAEDVITAGPPTPRALAARAAVHTASRRHDAARSWTSAALAHEGPDDAACAALERAIALQPVPVDLWRRAAWAVERGESPEPWWAQALALDPDGQDVGEVPLPTEAERALAKLAEERGAAVVAAGAWQRVLARSPAEEAAWDRAAELLEGAGRLEAARRVWEERLEALDAGQLPEPATPRWRVGWQIARLHAAAGAPEEALAALQGTVEEDFLHPEAWSAALGCPGVSLEPTLQGWWSHIHRLLAGASALQEGHPLPGRAAWTRDQLDALHPGGVGWLDRLRASLDPVQPPDRKELIRGLQRLDPEAHPRAAAAVRLACDALGLPAPDTFLFHGDGAWGASAWATDPPALLIGATHLKAGPRYLSDPALTALVAVELTHLRCGHPLLTQQTDLLGSARSAYSAFGRYARTAEGVVDLVSLMPGIDHLTRLQRLLLTARRVLAARSALDRAGDLAPPLLNLLGSPPAAGGAVGRERLAGAALSLRIQADRAALQITGDLRATVDMVLRASTRSATLADRVVSEGLAAVLQADDGPSPEEALRLSALVQHAATLPGEPPPP